MADESIVEVRSWPEAPAKLSHTFELDEPCPVSVSFEKTPAHVVVQGHPEQPLEVDMNMHVRAEKPVPVCISLCEPICAKSEYDIGITIFDRPVATISVRGLTRLFNCREDF